MAASSNPKIDPAARYKCLDGHVSDLGSFYTGEIAAGTHPDVRTHPELWVLADTPDAEFLVAQQAYRRRVIARATD